MTESETRTTIDLRLYTDLLDIIPPPDLVFCYQDVMTYLPPCLEKVFRVRVAVLSVLTNECVNCGRSSVHLSSFPSSFGGAGKLS